MIIDISYKSAKGSRRIKKEASQVLGIKNSSQNIIQYDGMLICFYDQGIRINTLVTKNNDWTFLNQILDAVFPNTSVGISGFGDDRAKILPNNTKLFWM